MSSLLRKLRGDIAAMPGRFALMIIAIAASSAAVIAMLLAYAVLTREMVRNYQAVNPAAAQLLAGPADLLHSSAAILSRVQQLPMVSQVEVGGHLNIQLEVASHKWVRALIFVVPDVQAVQINKIQLDAGRWPQLGEILLERKALGLANTSLGGSLGWQGHTGERHSLTVSGLAHDPALAPADTEHIIYGYISYATLAALQESADENYLKFTVPQAQMNSAAIENIAAEIVELLAPQVALHKVRIPPPGRHPHQTQMLAGLRMLLLFSLLALLLGAVLIATSIWGLLAQQTRQIGIMKALGASSGQITLYYTALVAAVGFSALLIALPLGIAAGKGLVNMTASLLNLQISDYSLPLALGCLSGFFCIGLPVLLALFPIRSAANKRVRVALDSCGVAENFATKKSRPAAALPLSPLWLLVLRNLGRRPVRTALTLLLLAVSGAMFLASQNILSSWDSLARAAATHRHYQLDIHLPAEVPPQTLTALQQTIAGIAALESWSRFAATPVSDSGLAIERVYPDGGHGSLTLYSLPQTTQMISREISAGRWFDAGEADAVVLNQAAYKGYFSHKKIGDWIAIYLQDKPVRLRLVGIMLEPLAGASLYLSDQGPPSVANTLRVALTDSAPENIDQAALAVEQFFNRQGIKPNSITTENHRRQSANGHLLIMVLILVMIAVAMLLVGFLSLATVISTQVSERLREFAVMRTLGAKNITIFSLVINESLLMALCSYLLALPVAILFSWIIVGTLARISEQPLTVAVSVDGLWLWLCIVLAGAFFSGLIPALHAMRFNLREALIYK